MARRYAKVPVYEFGGSGGLYGYKRVLVREARGAFILHRAVNLDFAEGPFTVTHLPSGAVVAKGVELVKARALLRTFAAIPGDWSFTERANMPKGLRRRCKAARRKVVGY